MVFDAQSKGEDARREAEAQLLVQTSSDLRLAAYTTSVLRSLRGGAKLQEGKLAGGEDDEESQEDDGSEDEDEEDQYTIEPTSANAWRQSGGLTEAYMANPLQEDEQSPAQYAAGVQ